MKDEKIYYLVMRMNTTVKTIDPVSGEEVSVKLGGASGYIPCFDNIEDAQEASSGGKYQILAVKDNS